MSCLVGVRLTSRSGLITHKAPADAMAIVYPWEFFVEMPLDKFEILTQTYLWGHSWGTCSRIRVLWMSRSGASSPRRD